MAPLASPTSTALNLSVTQPARPPIHRLYVEVLAEIFTYCLPEISEDSWPYGVSYETPLLLCKICSSWRSLAISTPRLWQTFIFNFGWICSRQSMVKSVFGHIRTWLGRSGTLPLTIRIRLYMHSTSMPVVTDALEALFEFSSRWAIVSIDMEPCVPWPSSIGVLPNLHYFDGRMFNVEEFPFTSAPSLKRLLLFKLPPNPMYMSKIPWNQLTELSFGVMSSSIAANLELFQGCPLLEQLKISVHSYNEGRALPLSSILKIKHETLRSLDIRMAPDTSVILEYLTLPALTELNLSGMTIPTELICFSQLLDLLTRSKCKLQKLYLARLRFKPDQLLECLKHTCCQTLTSLSIKQESGKHDLIPVINDTVLSQLTFSEEPDKLHLPLCPKLTKLVLEHCYCSEASASASSLGRMVLSRCFGRASDKQLRSLKLVTRYTLSPKDRKLLELAQDKGGLEFFHKTIDDEDF